MVAVWPPTMVVVRWVLVTGSVLVTVSLPSSKEMREVWRSTVPTQPPAARPCFVPADAALVDVRYHADHRPDLKQMVTSTLEWDLCV